MRIAGGGVGGSLAIVAGSLLLAGMATASGPSVWIVEGRDLAAGQARGVSLTDDGTATLAPPQRQRIETEEPRIWSMAATAVGIYYGAGEDGRVRFRADGDPAERVVLERGGLAAQAMTVAADGTLYVAMGPGGEIFRLGAGAPADEPWARLEQRYVWAMALDGEGRLVVATGGDGRILRLAADGAPETVYDTPQDHVTALAVTPDGTIFAGTESSAYVYRIGPDGDVMVLLDAPHREITGLLVSGASLWVSAAGGEGGAASAAGAPVAPGDEAVVAAVANGGRARGAGDQGGAVYRIDADGLVDSMWSSDELSPYALAETGAGVIVGTGPSARLLVLSSDPGVWGLLEDLDEGQVVGLAGGKRLVAAIANPGRIVAMEQGHRTAGSLESRPRDAGATSRWGTLRWSADVPAGTALQLRTRSGNSGVPDDTWSDWSAPLSDSQASRVSSPAARFLQWRAEFSSNEAALSPRLRRVEMVYVTRNRRPQIDALTVHPAGVVFRDTAGFDDLPFAQVPPQVARELRDSGGDAGQSSASGRSFLGRAYYVAGLRTVSWEASDPDQDALIFDLRVRLEEGGGPWMTVASGLVTNSYLLDTRKLPDGHYLVRVRANDGPTRIASESLHGDRTQAGLVVDNTAPEATGFAAVRDGTGMRISGRAHDRTSVIASLQYSLDGGEWTTVGAADGAADSAIEDVVFELTELGVDEHLVIVRIGDSALNERTVRVPVPAARQ